MRRVPLLFVLFALALLFSSCSSNKNNQVKEAVELHKVGDEEEETASADSSETTLLSKGKHYYERRLNSQAKQAFEALRDRFPLGPYAEFAEIKIADIAFEGYDYAEAALLYEDILNNRPASQAAPYLLMRAGRSHQLAQKGLGRDISGTHKAIEFYDKAIQRYPNSIYAPTIRSLKEKAEGKIAAYEKMIIDFYHKQENLEAYAARNKEFEERWGNRSFSVENGNDHLGALASIEGEKSLLTSKPLLLSASRTNQSLSKQRRVRLDVPLQSATINDPPTSSTTTARVNVLAQNFRGLECDEDEGFIFIYLKSDISSQEVQSIQASLKAQASGLTLQVPGFKGSIVPSQSCFATDDLNIDESGELSLRGRRTAKLMSLSNPPRLLLIVE